MLGVGTQVLKGYFHNKYLSGGGPTSWTITLLENGGPVHVQSKLAGGGWEMEEK